MRVWGRGVRRGFITLAFLTVWPASAAQAQQRPWAVTLEGAVSDMHGETRVEGPAGALRLSRRLMGYEWLRGELAMTGGTAEEDRGFGTVELGVELRWCSTCRFTPFIGGGGGWLKETHWDGGMLRANAGVEARLSSRFSARLMAQAGTHDGVRGPHLATLGLIWHFGRPSGGPSNQQ
jgi:hypothetical protein